MSEIVFNMPLSIHGTANDAVITQGSLNTLPLKLGSATYYLGTVGGSPITSLAGFSAITSTSFTGTLSGNASTATKLATARTITLTGDVTGSIGFDGSGNVSIATTAHVGLNLANNLILSTGNATSPTLGFNDVIHSTTSYFRQTNESFNILRNYRSAGETSVLAVNLSNGSATFAAGVTAAGFATSSGNITTGGTVTGTSVKGGASTTLASSGAEGQLAMGPADYYWFVNANNAGLYSASKGYALQWSIDSSYFKAMGDIYGTGFQVSSDSRLKKAAIVAVARPIPEIAPFRQWQWLGESRGANRGVFAQDLQQVAPEYVRQDDDGYFSVDYGRAAFEATYYVHGKVTTLRSIVQKLEQRLARLEASPCQ